MGQAQLFGSQYYSTSHADTRKEEEEGGLEQVMCAREGPNPGGSSLSLELVQPDRNTDEERIR